MLKPVTTCKLELTSTLELIKYCIFKHLHEQIKFINCLNFGYFQFLTQHKNNTNWKQKKICAFTGKNLASTKTSTIYLHPSPFTSFCISLVSIMVFFILIFFCKSTIILIHILTFSLQFYFWLTTWITKQFLELIWLITQDHYQCFLWPLTKCRKSCKRAKQSSTHLKFLSNKICCKNKIFSFPENCYWKSFLFSSFFF